MWAAREYSIYRIVYSHSLDYSAIPPSSQSTTKEAPKCSSSWWLCFCSQSSEACLSGRKAGSGEIILEEISAWFSSYCLFCFSSVAYRERHWRISSAHCNRKFPRSTPSFVSIQIKLAESSRSPDFRRTISRSLHSTLSPANRAAEGRQSIICRRYCAQFAARKAR
jgi:hypothetical protein